MMLYVVLWDALRPGQFAPQTAHVTSAFAADHAPLLVGWHRNGGSVVVLEASAEALPRLREAFSCEGVPTAMFREPDLGGALTAVAIACERTHPLVRRHLRRLALAGSSLSPPCPSGSGSGF